MERKKNEEIKEWISSSSLIVIYMIHLPTVHVCTNFQSSRPHSSRDKGDEKFQCWKLERKKNEEIKGWISSSSLIPVNMIHLPTVHVCTKFQSSRPHSSWEKCDKKFQCWKLERKKNEEIMRWISSSSLIPVNMIHLPTVYVCTKFQSSRPHSSWEKSDEKFQCWKLERKKNEEIKGWISSSSLILVHMIHLPTVHACTNFQSFGHHSSREKVWRKISMLKIGEKEKQVAQRATIAHLSSMWQGQISFKKHINRPWKPEARNRTRPSFYACPGNQQLWWWFDQKWMS